MAIWYSLGIAFFAAIGTFLFVGVFRLCINEVEANVGAGIRYWYRDDE
jgi:hypothetical protein